MPPPIRVLLIGPSMRILGGQAVQIQQVLRHLGARPEVDIHFQWMNAPLPAPLRDIRGLRTLVAWLVYVPVVFARAWRYDILHVFTASYWGYTLWVLPALLAAKLFRKKLLLHYHDGQARDHIANWKSAIPTIKMADTLISPSAFLVDVFRDFGLHCRAIFNVIERETYIYRKRSTLRPVLLHNRILEPLYNVECALRTFKRVQARYPEASLIIAHDGPSGPSLEAYARELKLTNYRFIGRVPHDQIGKLYDAVDIYLTTTNIDNMPVSLLECAASGLPIVATNTGGIPYIVTNERTALLFPVNDDEAAANACFRLLSDADLVERLTAAAYEDVAQYTGPAVADQWIGVYRELVAGQAPKP